MKLGFRGLHPVSELIFYVFVLSFTLTSSHPVSLITGLVCAFLYDIRLRGKKAVSFSLKFVLPLIIASALINGLFSHFGVTVLFTLPDGNNFTLEAVIYGLVFSLRAASSVIWLMSLNEVLTNDRILFLFGRFSPKTALVISMSLRFIPLISEQAEKISDAQKGIGALSASDSIMSRLKSSAKRLSILVSWTLERGIDTADSMRARGYGLKGRTSFNSYAFTVRDIMLSCLVISGAIVFVLTKNELTASYDPVISIPHPCVTGIVSSLLFTAIMLFPFIYDILEERKWSILK